MSIQLIHQYTNKVERIIQYGGSRNESALRKPFQDLLEHYARGKNLLLVAEIGVMRKLGRTVYPDDTLKDSLRQDWVEVWPLERINVERSTLNVTRLMARKDKGEIEVDTLTTLRGVPPEAWGYRLGTYSALEWILERYKEKKPKDPTIAEKFNTYRFAHYKEQVIELLTRVCRVSVETMNIVREMEILAPREGENK